MKRVFILGTVAAFGIASLAVGQERTKTTTKNSTKTKTTTKWNSKHKGSGSGSGSGYGFGDEDDKDSKGEKGYKGDKDDDRDYQRSGDVSKAKSFSVSSGGQLMVSVDGGDVHVTPSGKSEVTVKIYGDDESDFDDLRMTQSGNNVRISNRSGCGDCNLRYELTVPTQYDVDVRTSEGNVTVASGLTGRIHGLTSAGNVRVGDEQGTVDMETSGGNIKTGNIKGDLTVSTSGGEIILGTIDGQAEVSTSGGDISVQNVGKTLTATTSGGDIRIGDVGGEASVSTSGGNIIIGKVGGKASMSTAGGDIEISSASGSVIAKTAGGNLQLDEITGSCNAKTAGGDIHASLIPTGVGPSKLSTASGDIQLYIPEDAKATIHARIRVQGGRWNDNEDYHIRSDFKADSQTDKTDEDDEIRAVYTLNGGGESITLETTNADIKIRRLTGTSHKK